MEILNRREQIKSAAIPPEIANPSTLVTTSDKATKNKAGIVKIGDGINVSNGVISVPNSGGATVIEIGDGATDLSNETLTAILAAFTAETPMIFKRTETDENNTLVEYLTTYSRETGENYDVLTILTTAAASISYNLTDGTITT